MFSVALIPEPSPGRYPPPGPASPSPNQPTYFGPVFRAEGKRKRSYNTFTAPSSSLELRLYKQIGHLLCNIFYNFLLIDI